jgi:hypothetical protein
VEVNAKAGDWSVIVMVEGSKGEPISGATVSVPCTGWPAKTTDATGEVAFSGDGSCPCSNSPAEVTTPKGCDDKFNVSCDTYTEICTE